MSNDGTYLEEHIEKYLKKLRYANFRWRRLHDSRAARSQIKAQPADFFLAHAGECYHLECKSRDSKTERLEKIDQLPELKAWEQAGVKGYVLVHFHRQDIFKLVDVHDLPFGVPSWSLRDHETFKTFDAVMLRLIEVMMLC